MTMTAVAVQQHRPDRQQYNPRQSPHSSSPQQSQPQSYTSMPSLQNGSSTVMNPRPAVSNDPVQVNGGRTQASDYDRSGSTSAARINAHFAGTRQGRRSSLQARPTSAPNGAAESSPEDSEVERRSRRPKPLLVRAKSDFGPQNDDLDSQEEDVRDWGARHGFEDHYASEEYVSQLANVGCAFHSLSSKTHFPLSLETRLVSCTFLSSGRAFG
jgi:regulator-associated protein of mTOR